MPKLMKLIRRTRTGRYLRGVLGPTRRTLRKRKKELNGIILADKKAAINKEAGEIAADYVFDKFNVVDPQERTAINEAITTFITNTKRMADLGKPGAPGPKTVFYETLTEVFGSVNAATFFNSYLSKYNSIRKKLEAIN